MSNFIKVVLVIAICICMAVFTAHAAQTDCQKVATAMAPCRSYLKSGGAVPNDCCKAISNLKSAATTAATRKSYCECLKTQAKSNNVVQSYASSLPDKCNVKIGYPISYNTDCTKVN